MDSRFFSLLDLAIAGIPALAFGIWQLISVNREIAKDKAKKEAAPSSESVLPEGSGHPVGKHRLDDR